MNLRAWVNVLTNKAYLGEGKEASEPPADMADDIEAANLMLIEAAAETSDELIEKYFEEETLTVEETREGMRQGCQKRRFQNRARIRHQRDAQHRH